MDNIFKIKSNASFEKNEYGVYIYKSQPKKLDVIYENKQFKKWMNLLHERINYYTGKKSIAGKIANLSYMKSKHLSIRGKDDYVLDIGCGDGAVLNYIGGASTYIGVDRSIDRLNILKQKFPQVTAICADSSDLPLLDGAVKYIYSSHAFEHLWYLGETVMECHRCLQENGSMQIIIPTEGGLWNLGRFLFSKRYFSKRCPELDFELISHIEHANLAKQVVRTLETFFETKKIYYPLLIPSIYLNLTMSIICVKKQGIRGVM